MIYTNFTGLFIILSISSSFPSCLLLSSIFLFRLFYILSLPAFVSASSRAYCTYIAFKETPSSNVVTCSVRFSEVRPVKCQSNPLQSHINLLTYSLNKSFLNSSNNAFEIMFSPERKEQWIIIWV
jgi:hypothetical protein